MKSNTISVWLIPRGWSAGKTPSPQKIDPLPKSKPQQKIKADKSPALNIRRTDRDYFNA
jgi:hypothetical protein